MVIPRKSELATAWAKVPFLQALGDVASERLLETAELKTLCVGERLWFEGQASEHYSFVVRGRLKLVKSSACGRDTILEMPSSGELLCANAVSCFIPFCCAAEAMEDGPSVILVPRRNLQPIVEEHPDIAQGFMRAVTARGIHLCERVEELSGGQVDQRIALLLLKLTDRVGIKLKDGEIRIPVPLSRKDIADLCGTTIETAIRIMSRFKKDGVVESAARGFLIRDRKSLESISQGIRGVAVTRLPVVKD
jgi:CRP-like cAMP-binding protein